MNRVAFIIGRGVLIGCVCAAISSGVSYGQRDGGVDPGSTTSSPTEAPQAPAAPAIAPETVPLTDVPERLLALTDWIAAAEAELATSVEAVTSDAQISDLEGDVNLGSAEIDELLNSSPSLPDLREASASWQIQASRVSQLQTELAARDAKLQEQTATAAADIGLWQATRDQLASEDAPLELLARVNEAIGRLSTLGVQLQANARRVRLLEGEVATINTVAAGTSARLAQAVAGFQERLIRADSVPLWRAFSATAPTTPTRSTIASKFATAGSHVLINRSYIVSLVASLIVFIAALVFLRRAVIASDPKPADERMSATYVILFGLFCAVMFVSSATAHAPLLISGVQKLLLTIIALLLLPKLTVPSARLPMTVFLIFFTAHSVCDLAVTAPAANRLALVILHVAGAGALWWLGARDRVAARSDGLRTLGMVAMRLGALLLAIACVANLFGYVLLAMVLSDGVFESARTFANTMTLFLGLAGIIAATTKIPGIRSLAVVKLRGPEFVTWTRRGLFGLALFLWSLFVMHQFTVDKQVSERLTSLFTFQISVGSVSFTIGGVFGALLVFVLGVLIANAARFVVREEFLNRLPLSRGLPDAISNALFYLVLLGVFLLSLGAAGVELDKLTVLTGALGVGIGFGLQNVVNNFVSGIILQFERPIHIGDVVELPGIKGKVSHMGIRSSTLQTTEGAEVIVPNGNLVSNQFINWTLSEKRRRVDIPLGVAYGTDPDKVAALLCEAAASQRDVLEDPPPLALFMSFGDSALNFELRFWAPDQDTWPVLRSDVLRAIVRVFEANGIEIPFPQRDVHVRSVESGGAAGDIESAESNRTPQAGSP